MYWPISGPSKNNSCQPSAFSYQHKPAMQIARAYDLKKLNPGL